MKYEDLYIAGVGSWFPKPVSVDDAVADGRYDEAGRRRTGQVSVAVAGDGDTQAEMAVRAGAEAVARSGRPVESYRLLLHATAGFAGLDGWNLSSYIQDRVLDGNGVSYEIRQQSNGAMAAIPLAAAYLGAGPADGSVLITASDRFELPVWDRWRAYAGLLLGDGASAAVLTRTPERASARILSAVTESRAELEGAMRGGLPLRANPDPQDAGLYPVDLSGRMAAFSAERPRGLSGVFREMNAALNASVYTALAEAGTNITEVDHVILPNFGRSMLEQEVLDPLGLDDRRTPWRWSREVGHAGAADQFGAWQQLASQGALEPGQRVLMTGIGIGFNWTTVVAEVLVRHEPTT